MKPIQRLFAILTILPLLLSACGQATPDAAAIATTVAQTVEAHYTAQAAAQPTQTSAPTPEPATLTPTVPVQPTKPPQPTPTSGGSMTPCLSANYLDDITIKDYSVVAPGATFTKTWRVKNTGSCTWDASYKLIFESGNAMGTVTSFALPSSVAQNQTVDISISLTAPATEGVYKGFWRIETPFGGTMGFGEYNSPLSVIITAATNSKKEFQVVSVTYEPVRRVPSTGCPAAGTVYTLTAYITVNTAGLVDYHIVRNPDDGSKPEVITLNFKEAGTKTVTYDWRLKPDAVKNIDRSMAVYIDEPNNALFNKVLFNFSCP